jgi:hypothetical protein
MTDIQIDTGFPGGNAVIDAVNGDTVRLHPDLRDTVGDWFYWSFRVRGAAGRTLNFEFTAQDPVGVRGPAVSLDEGLTWQWLGNASGCMNAFQYRMPAEAVCARFSFGMNYTQSDWQRFVGGIAATAGVRQDSLCTSRKGRPVPLLRVGANAGRPRHRLVLTARHHCCEMMASYVMEGILGQVLAADETGAWFRTHVEVVSLPFMDCDGVEDGDQGKNRAPRDHNRDYAGESIYPETRALRRLAEEWAGEGPSVMMDLHCPWIRGPYNEQVYQVGVEDSAIWQEQLRFAAILAQRVRGSLPYRQENDLPFGKRWNDASNYEGGMPSSAWFSRLPNVRLATSLEIPYANAGGVEVNAESARAFGRDLAAALRAYLAS